MRSEPAVLLLTALRLYDTGVGYFERTGSLDAERTTLPVPASHLDDALASLVVLTPGAGAVVHGLTFDSRLTGGMARALAGLPPGSDGAMGWRVLLGSLKGVHVEVRAGTSTFVGRLVDVEGPDEPSSMLVLVTDRADLVRVPATAVQSVHPTDGSFSRRLDAALDATGAQAARERRWIDVLGEAGGHGPVTIGYVAETPLWRTTYRIVLAPDGGRSRLQGWALVHNDTDEDWQGVRVALVNGRPDSFLYPLAAPRYARRALLRPDDALSTVPQLLGQSPDSLWGDNVDDDASAGGLGLSGEGAGGGGRGEGIGLGSIGTIGHGSGTYMEVLNGTDAEAAQTPPATGAEAGALFVYSLPDRLSLRAHGSALLPFVDAPIEATPVAWVEGDQPARTAVRVVNSTAQTLPPGPVSFFFAGGFSGESGLDRLKPGDRRFVRYGMDLDVEAKVTPGRAPSTREAPKHLTFDRDALIEHFERKTDTAHTIENRSGVARDVDLVLGVVAGAKVTGADTVDFDTERSTPIAVFRVPAKSRVARTVATVEDLARRRPVTDLRADALETIAASADLGPKDKAVAVDAAARVRALEDTRRAKAESTGALEAIEKELERLREDAKALGSDHGAAAPPEFARQLLAAEARHTAAREAIDRLASEESARADAVATALKRLGE